ncbi:ATP-binding cassette domain-containing protein [Terrimonas pollutisoli]|uniref:ATP-binding cassette domain-containing protein n=1 Tax=Terrimonas pollutisoli TaxID=3034147 RepID=UPI0023EC72EF|nr:ATP-binding cassette domain-containing protein [Terrimonas sp. H1YJ31]
MELRISNLLPTYFDQSRTQSSDVWGKELLFEKGEWIKIVAPSGSGKSSLMNFLYGIRNDYNGTISYDNKSIRDFSAEDSAHHRKDHLSIVFQDLRLFPAQTVLENLEIKRQLNPFHPPEKIKEMANRLGIGDKLSSTCNTCSYGEQQRIAIIRSLLQPFEFLLLDEPFSHLDDNNAQKAMVLMLEEARARNAAIIFADLERIDFYPYTRLLHL